MANRRENPDGRDRRMLATLRANLGMREAPKAQPQRVNPTPRSRYKTVEEALECLNKALVQPSTSLYDFELFLRQQSKQFDAETCELIADSIKKYCMKSEEYRFIIKVASDNINCLDLVTAIAKEFLILANEYMTDEDIGKQQFPELMGSVIAWKWPPGKAKAIESVNPILYLGINVVMSWVNVMDSYGKAPDSKKRNEKNEENNEDDSDDDIAGESDEEEEMFSQEVTELAIAAVCTVCNVAQRNFWLNFMEEFDKVFVVVKALLIANVTLSKSSKESLLNLYINLFKWSATGQTKQTTSHTQT
ncbi:unnamed protein product [Bursaphelenchus xylophilus]|uniref:(pine wood nematode) hypothetical protein n=1 Tax=Bursaphelenchus xylophilus TaxID=6326 RepID=A0A1I7RSE3_BURXY|nr:unnamed protein product [Bursaphelenchus xylophilus]CAG9123014.1 unnamed protein product [Bursaphelenchus xylophilus]